MRPHPNLRAVTAAAPPNLRALIRRRARVLNVQLSAVLGITLGIAYRTAHPATLRIVASTPEHATAWAALQILALVVGGALAGLAAAALARGVLRRVAASGPRVAALADPARWPCCGAPAEAHDDAISPHYCARADR